MLYPIKLDRERQFKYGMRAISLVEKKFKKPISKVDFNNLTMEESAVFIWAGLVHEDKNLSSERVMDIVDQYSNFTTVINLASEALQGAFPTEEIVEDGNEEKN